MAATAMSILSMDCSDYGNRPIGYKTGLRDVWSAVQTISQCETTVLIQGETGTGKELVAKAIHDESSRRNRPYIKVNCAALPAALLESELFGHERGAFTGACNQTLGRFEVAHTGTLFLDEIGELPLELQPKLLRVLQEHEFERLGSHRTIRTDVRIVAATNQNLLKMVLERKFRADLYYRLNIFPIEMPALRERPADIPLLVNHFIHRFARRMKKEVGVVPETVMASLVDYEWPGNVRELQNLMERAVILYSSGQWRFPLDSPGQGTETSEVRTRTLADAERHHIVATLRDVRGVVGGRNGAAVRLGLPRTTLLAKMKKLGIDLSDALPRFEAGHRGDPYLRGAAEDTAKIGCC